jgi:predicted hydrocarbon binding protein
MPRKLSRVPNPSGEIVAEDLRHETIKEDWNIRELTDCAYLQVRIVMRKTCRGLTDDEKTICYTVSTVPDVGAESSEAVVY